MAYISLDFEAYRHNLKHLGSITGDIAKIMVVLKDNAYGHGLKEMAPLAAAAGAKRAVVKDLHEAMIAAPFFEKVLILVEPKPSTCMVHNKLAYSACELTTLEAMPQSTTVHLKVDTGMSRNGICEDELEKAFEIICKRKLNLEGVFTHYYGADSLSAELFVQQKRFQEVKERAKILAHKYSLEIPLFHSCSSAALLRSQGAFEDDFARVGIASYGYTEMDKGFEGIVLKPVLSLWANRISTRVVKKGAIIGYGAAFKALEDMKVSTYDVGYGDGLFRNDGTKNLHVKNQKPFLGRTSMDMFSLEDEADEVCVFDDAAHMAEQFNTISYEVLTRLSPSIKRIVKSGN